MQEVDGQFIPDELSAGKLKNDIPIRICKNPGDPNRHIECSKVLRRGWDGSRIIDLPGPNFARTFLTTVQTTIYPLSFNRFLNFLRRL